MRGEPSEEGEFDVVGDVDVAESIEVEEYDAGVE